jgi:ribonuclease HI
VLRGRRVISHHIYSSIWSSIKSEFVDILMNSGWLVGNGNNINFWLDNWCGDSLVSQLNIPTYLHSHLKATVSDFIVNKQWNFPFSVLMSFPSIKQIVEKVTIPIENSEDKIIWRGINDGNLSFKEAFLYKYGTGQNINWAKTLWNQDIPPSKSLLIWRLMHNKTPTDDNLMTRGLQLPSMCSACNADSETSFHLFFKCKYALNLWNWLFSIINISVQFGSIDDFWLLLNRDWSPQGKIVLQACMFNIINIIWQNRNNTRFQGKHMHWRAAINLIIAHTSLSGNNTNKTFKGNMQEFTFLKACKVNIKPPRAPIIKEVIWAPPLSMWVKANTDGAASSNPIKASAGGIFRNSEGLCIGSFFQLLGPYNAFFAELVADMNAIEIAYNRGFHNLWLETDSQLVTLAFRSSSCIPWGLRNRWQNCIARLRSMRFVVSHIYREGNSCADGLANIGLHMSSFDLFWSDSIPDSIRGEYTRNRLGMPNFRFCTF